MKFFENRPALVWSAFGIVILAAMQARPATPPALAGGWYVFDEAPALDRFCL